MRFPVQKMDKVEKVIRNLINNDISCRLDTSPFQTSSVSLSMNFSTLFILFSIFGYFTIVPTQVTIEIHDHFLTISHVRQKTN